MSSPWLFLSYSGVNDDEKRFVQKFFNDLVSELQQKVGHKGVDSREIGFMDDGSIPPGRAWLPVLSEKIASCRVLVCLYSPAYFESPWCGREFKVFIDRVEGHFQSDPPSGLLLPILWGSPRQLDDPLPGAAAQYQYFKGEAGSEYLRCGLLHLMKREKNGRQDYVDLLSAFAEYIAAGVKRGSLPPLVQPPRLDRVKSAFHQDLSPGPTPEEPEEQGADEAERPAPPTPPEPRRRWLLPLLVAAVGVLCGAAYWGYLHSRPVMYKAHEWSDNFDVNKKLDEKWDYPQGKWEVVRDVPGDDDGYLLVTSAEKIGTPLDENHKFIHLDDFKVQFKVRFDQGEIVSWVLRAQADQRSGYLFELEKKGSSLYLNGWIYRQGEKKEKLRIVSGEDAVGITTCCKPGDGVRVVVVARGLDFQYAITFEHDDPPGAEEPEPDDRPELGSKFTMNFTDGAGAFNWGSFGFLETEPGGRMRVELVRIFPGKVD
jgi:hypothetical protein